MVWLEAAMFDHCKESHHSQTDGNFYKEQEQFDHCKESHHSQTTG